MAARQQPGKGKTITERMTEFIALYDQVEKMGFCCLLDPQYVLPYDRNIQ